MAACPQPGKIAYTTSFTVLTEDENCPGLEALARDFFLPRLQRDISFLTQKQIVRKILPQTVFL